MKTNRALMEALEHCTGKKTTTYTLIIMERLQIKLFIYRWRKEMRRNIQDSICSLNLASSQTLSTS